jgi:hypothetical protein
MRDAANSTAVLLGAVLLGVAIGAILCGLAEAGFDLEAFSRAVIPAF